VGKTAIARGSPAHCVGDVPEGLKDKRVIALDLGAMVAGSKYRGEFRGPAQGGAQGGHVVRRPVILFIDRVAHAGRAGAAEGAMDAGNMLKAGARARRAALHRRDDARRVPQVHRERRRPRAALPADRRRSAIRRGHHQHPSRLKERYEVHHGVRITDAAIVAAAVLSNRLHHRSFPSRTGESI